MGRRPVGVVPDQPRPGQESVWDYPRPPRWDVETQPVEVWFGGERIARTDAAIRVLETSHPPTYYLPPDAFVAGTLRPAPGSSQCEWKGVATYLDLVSGFHVASRAAWTYPSPTEAFTALTDHVSLYPGAVDRCTVAGEIVQPQPGGFYGGWITSRVVGPFKGAPGTLGW